MVDFGDEVIIHSYKIPWFIWIQLLVMFLAILLLYFYSISAPDFSESSTPSCTTPSLTSPTNTGDANASSSTRRSVLGEIEEIEKPGTKANLVTNRLGNMRVGGEGIKGEVTASTGIVMNRGGGTSMEREGSSRYFHPCHYFKLARVAFLKCLGLESPTEEFSTQRHSKTKES